MTVVNLKHLKVYTDNRGIKRFYFRRRGYPEVALPGEPLSNEFMKAYHAALSGAPAKPKTRYEQGSIADALTKWYASAKFQSLEPKTRDNYRKMMERELSEVMNEPIRRLEPRHIQQWMDDMTDRPGAAKSFLKRLKTFLKFCASPRVGLIPFNPASAAERPEYESDGFIPWDENDAAAFEKKWPLGTKQFLAYALMAFTGQRVSDAAKMGRQDERLDGKALAVTQAKLRKGKKRVKIEVPVHPRLRQAINACGVQARMIYLETQYGRPYSVKGLGQDFSRWATEAGLSEGKTAHGVRKLAGSRLAEAGCSEKEIMAVLGLSSIAEATLYTEAANQKRLANSAMQKIDAAEKVARKEAALTRGGKVLKRAPTAIKRPKAR